MQISLFLCALAFPLKLSFIELRGPPVIPGLSHPSGECEDAIHERIYCLEEINKILKNWIVSFGSVDDAAMTSAVSKVEKCTQNEDALDECCRRRVNNTCKAGFWKIGGYMTKLGILAHSSKCAWLIIKDSNTYASILKKTLDLGIYRKLNDESNLFKRKLNVKKYDDELNKVCSIGDEYAPPE